jgi:hypothetical protein
MVMQKDWMVYDLEHGDVFCVSIVRYSDSPRGRGRRRRSRQWYLTKFVNYFDLDALEVEGVLGKEWESMFESMKTSSEYSYTISHHNFLPGDMNTGYWKGLLRSRYIHDLQLEGVELPVNRKNLEGELYRLGLKPDHSGVK